MFVGSLLLQTAWIIALPPFRGIDEFDHAYRAAAVAGGQWMPDYRSAQHGRGDLIAVPTNLVTAAAPVCEEYRYTGHDNCHPVQNLGHGLVTVASGASRYNPVFYWIIGTPARPFSGAMSLYVMRFMAALLCSSLLALAAWALNVSAASRWPLIALAAAMTPVTVYSTSLGAPNGVEMIAGLGLWATLVGLRSTSDPTIERLLILATIPNTIVLSGVRTLGPLWLGMIVLAGVIILGRSRLSGIALRNKGSVICAACAAVIAAATGLWWSNAAGANAGSDGYVHVTHPVSTAFSQLPLWVFQSIAAFPTRSEIAPTVVYACELVIVLALAGTALMYGTARDRVALTGVIAASLAVPLLITLRSISELGAVWQGRYTLPFALGIPLLAGLTLETRDLRHRLLGPVLLAAVIAGCVAQSASVLYVLEKERVSSPLVGTAEWAVPPAWLAIVLASLGVCMWTLACLRPGPGASASASGPRIGQGDLDVASMQELAS